MKNTTTYTAYIVRDAFTRRFLNRKAYSGRVRGIWNTIGEAQIFYSREKAQSCASNINARRDDDQSLYAQVRPVQIHRRMSRTSR